jgi:hypothetical protein
MPPKVAISGFDMNEPTQILGMEKNFSFGIVGDPTQLLDNDKNDFKMPVALKKPLAQKP